MADFTKYKPDSTDDNTAVNPRVAAERNDYPIPAPQPTYSTRHCMEKRGTDTFDEQDSENLRQVRRRRSRYRNGLSEWAWVVIAGALFSVVLIMSLSAFLLVKV